MRSSVAVLAVVVHLLGFSVLCGCGTDSDGPMYTLTDADKATLIHAARVLAEYEDPSDVGPPERVQAFRRLAERVEHGELGIDWEDFRAVIGHMVLVTRMAVARPAEDPDRRDRERAQRAEFVRFCAALDGADILGAKRSLSAWLSHTPTTPVPPPR